MKRLFFPFALMFAAWLPAQAQLDSIKKHLEFSGYLEAYYGFDLANPIDHTRPGFMYSHNRHNEVALNLAMAKVSLTQSRVRANLGLMAGTYVTANLSNEPLALRYVYEANVGVKLSKTMDTWLDAGIFPSHIGFESVIGKDCWTLTRSMVADNTPYFESGLKVGHTSANGKWFVSGLFLNGWQRMSHPVGYNLPSVGHQLTWKPKESITLNSSSFIGSDRPDSLRQMRFFHDFYGIFQLSDSWSATVGFDGALERGFQTGGVKSFWYTPVAILRWQAGKRLTLAARGEYYRDADGIIVSTALPQGTAVLGYSLNVDVRLPGEVLWRTEFRGFQSDGEFFTDRSGTTSRYMMVTTCLAVGL